jgi:hypothetical protein
LPSAIPIWHHLWKLNIPRFILLFLWRACNDIFPTKNNLYKKKIVTDQFCPMCGSEAETNGHILWWCDSARAIWGSYGVPIQKSSVVAEDFFRIFAYLCARLEVEDFELFAVIAHKIWYRQSRVIFGGSVLPPSILLKEAIELIGDFRKDLVIIVDPVNGGQSLHRRWLKPMTNSIKINWNAALDGRKKIIGMGIVVRDYCLGVVKTAMCAVIPYIRDPTVAEAIGAQ